MVVDRRRIYSKRDRFRQLRAFCHVARLGSITQAAQHLELSQPSVSLHVRDLEHEFQAVLFDRGSFGISLTEAGERLYALAEPLLEGMEGVFAHFAERIKEDLTGRVEIAASVAGAALMLPPSIKRLRDRYPGVRVRVRNHTLGEGMALLRAGEVEFVLGARELLLEDMSVEYRETLCYDIVLITSLDHALAGRETVTPQEAAQWPSVVPPAGSYSRQFGEAAARQFGVEVRAVIEVSGWAVIKRYVERGLGISVVPSICVEGTDQVSVIPFEDSFLERSFGVYTLRSRALTGPARRLLELMIPEFAQASGRGIGLEEAFLLRCIRSMMAYCLPGANPTSATQP